MLLRGPGDQLSGEIEKGCLIVVRNIRLKIHCLLGPGILRVKERNVKGTFDFLSFREENKDIKMR